MKRISALWLPAILVSLSRPALAAHIKSNLLARADAVVPIVKLEIGENIRIKPYGQGEDIPPVIPGPYTYDVEPFTDVVKMQVVRLESVQKDGLKELQCKFLPSTNSQVGTKPVVFKFNNFKTPERYDQPPEQRPIPVLDQGGVSFTCSGWQAIMQGAPAPGEVQPKPPASYADKYKDIQDALLRPIDRRPVEPLQSDETPASVTTETLTTVISGDTLTTTLTKELSSQESDRRSIQTINPSITLIPTQTVADGVTVPTTITSTLKAGAQAPVVPVTTQAVSTVITTLVSDGAPAPTTYTTTLTAASDLNGQAPGGPQPGSPESVESGWVMTTVVSTIVMKIPVQG